MESDDYVKVMFEKLSYAYELFLKNSEMIISRNIRKKEESESEAENKALEEEVKKILCDES